jgi:hypothetical protein
MQRVREINRRTTCSRIFKLLTSSLPVLANVSRNAFSSAGIASNLGFLGEVLGEVRVGCSSAFVAKFGGNGNGKEDGEKFRDRFGILRSRMNQHSPSPFFFFLPLPLFLQTFSYSLSCCHPSFWQVPWQERRQRHRRLQNSHHPCRHLEEMSCCCSLGCSLGCSRERPAPPCSLLISCHRRNAKGWGDNL